MLRHKYYIKIINHNFSRVFLQNLAKENLENAVKFLNAARKKSAKILKKIKLLHTYVDNTEFRNRILRDGDKRIKNIL